MKLVKPCHIFYNITESIDSYLQFSWLNTITGSTLLLLAPGYVDWSLLFTVLNNSGTVLLTHDNKPSFLPVKQSIPFSAINTKNEISICWSETLFPIYMIRRKWIKQYYWCILSFRLLNFILTFYLFIFSLIAKLNSLSFEFATLYFYFTIKCKLL